MCVGRWILKFRSKVFDDAAGFFFGALVVEGDEFFEEVVVGEVLGPAVGVEDGGVEVVVELFEDGDEAAVVDLFVGGGEVGVGEGSGVDGAEFFEDVVHVGEGEAVFAGVFGELALAVGVEFFGESADAWRN